MTFETRLLAELRTVVEESAKPRWGRRLTAVAAGVAALSAVLAIGLGRAGPDESPSPLGPLGPQPAYAVEKLPDGGVAVTIRDVRRPADLQRKLIQAGVPAKVVLSRRGCVDKDGLPVEGVFGKEPPRGDHFFTLYPKALPPGTVVLIGLPGPDDPTAGYAYMAVYRTAEAPDCVRASEVVATP